MPRYLEKPKGTAFLDDATLRDVSNAICYTKAMNFLDTIANKLKQLVISLKNQFERLKRQVVTRAQGPILASVTVRTIPLGVKYEYVEYIKRYGPPTNGIFDENLLIGLRNELGIVRL